MATSFFKIPVDKLAWKDLNGKEVAQGIIRAYEFAVHDIKRTATHNKGIMNGVDAVALALGQDWRGIEAAAHTYATLDGGYRPLTKYRIAKDTSGREFLLGELELPIACASKGGVLGTNPAYNATHLVAGQPTGRQIAGILVSVGLAQNFAAMRALAVEGIQKGHMTLHAKNIAVSAGVPPNLIDEVVAFMSSKGTFDVGTVEDYMKAHKIYSVTKKGNISESSKKTFSTCFVKIDHPDLAETIILNLIIETPEDQKPIHLSITQDPEDKKAFGKIFGDHSYDWILKILLLSNQLTEVTELPGYQKTHQASLCYRLKLITILINRVVTAILRNYKEEGIEIIESVYSVCKGSNVEYKIPSSHFFLHNLLTELIATYRYYIDENIDNKFLREALIEDIMISLFGLKESYKYLYGITGLTKENYSIFIGHSSKRINLTQVLLIDILACDQSRITSEYIKHIVALGQVIELKAVSIRDVHKAELNDNSNYNCYYNWLKIHGKDAQRMNEKNKVEFLKSVDELNAGKISVDTSKIMNQIKFNLLLLNV